MPTSLVAKDAQPDHQLGGWLSNLSEKQTLSTQVWSSSREDRGVPTMGQDVY